MYLFTLYSIVEHITSILSSDNTVYYVRTNYNIAYSFLAPTFKQLHGCISTIVNKTFKLLLPYILIHLTNLSFPDQ